MTTSDYLSTTLFSDIHMGSHIFGFSTIYMYTYDMTERSLLSFLEIWNSLVHVKIRSITHHIALISPYSGKSTIIFILTEESKILPDTNCRHTLIVFQSKYTLLISDT